MFILCKIRGPLRLCIEDLQYANFIDYESHHKIIFLFVVIDLFFYFSICYLKKRDKFDFIFKIEFLLSMWLSVFCHYTCLCLMVSLGLIVVLIVGFPDQNHLC